MYLIFIIGNLELTKKKFGGLVGIQGDFNNRTRIQSKNFDFNKEKIRRQKISKRIQKLTRLSSVKFFVKIKISHFERGSLAS